MLIEVFPDLPLLVVITITPFAPRAPYAAVADASLRTVILAISLLFKLANEVSEEPEVAAAWLPLVIGTPSITYNGSFPAVIEERPRILMFATEPGVPEPLVIFKPATLPCSAWSTEATGI